MPMSSGVSITYRILNYRTEQIIGKGEITIHKAKYLLSFILDLDFKTWMQNQVLYKSLLEINKKKEVRAMINELHVYNFCDSKYVDRYLWMSNAHISVPGRSKTMYQMRISCDLLLNLVVHRCYMKNKEYFQSDHWTP